MEICIPAARRKYLWRLEPPYRSVAGRRAKSCMA